MAILSVLPHDNEPVQGSGCWRNESAIEIGIGKIDLATPPSTSLRGSASHLLVVTVWSTYNTCCQPEEGRDSTGVV